MNRFSVRRQSRAGEQILIPIGSDEGSTIESQLIREILGKSQLPVIEQAIEAATLMLGSDKSRGYCLEMVCADFLAGANLESGNTKPLRLALSRLFGLLTSAEQEEFLETVTTTP